MTHLQHEGCHGRHDQQQHDHDLEQEHLGGDAAPAQRRPQPGDRPPPESIVPPPAIARFAWRVVCVLLLVRSPGVVALVSSARTAGPTGRPTPCSTQ
ncbi:hypothetical protein [Streptomyces sp. NPDC046862]|uniref:hypothetical protein n=1 Tax=Streptomyces sp. NPDC046862 TaxID=3154603 RepID=UPI0034570AF1